jgi:hypothetical protein
MKRILLIGATGVFGQRLAAHLARLDGLELILTSRSPRKAEALAQALHSTAAVKAVLTPMALDHGKAFRQALAHIAPWLVIDCSGPFQGAGYDVARAALEAGAHVLDLADARDYILGYGAALDAIAQARGLVALTGASSSPALSSAAVDALTRGWRRIDSIEIAITPGGRSDVGEAVIAAILSYAGKPVPVWREGRLQETVGWASSQVITLPGLGRRRVSPVETVDAELLSARHAITSHVGFHAGLESPFEQWGIMALATLRHRGLLRDLQWLARPLLLARRLTRIPTGDSGGMVVTVVGLNAEGALSEARWSLLAQKGDGPHVPTLPAAAAVVALLAGRISPGARPAAGVLDLAVIEAEMIPYAITTRTDFQTMAGCLFATGLGAKAYAALPPAVRAFHDGAAAPVWAGRAEISTGDGLIARIIARIIGLPKAGKDVPLRVSVDRSMSPGKEQRFTETWTRNFGGQCFSSEMSVSASSKVTERFGPLTFALGLAMGDDGLLFPVTGGRIGPLPLPRFLMPRSEAREFQDDEGRFRFDVRLSLPLFGVLAHYQGWLKPRMVMRDDLHINAR